MVSCGLPTENLSSLTRVSTRAESQIAKVDLKPIQPIFKEEDFDRLFQVEDPQNKEEKQNAPQPPEGESGETEGADSADENMDESENEQEADSKKEKDKKPVKED